MKRFKHSLSHYRLLTCDMGQLVPCGITEVLPGDTFRQHTSMLVRLSPLLAPLMHPVICRVHHWWVPTRILWDGWEDFITGGNDGEGGSSGTYPTVTAGGSGFGEGSLPDYMGVPPDVANLEISELPIRAYNKIFNEYYRDQDLVTEVAEDSTDVQNIAWEKDYFTSSRPWSQRGPDVTLPLGTQAPVTGLGKWNQTFANSNVTVYETGGSGSVQYANAASIWDSTTSEKVSMEEDPNNPGFPGVFADLSSATAASVNDIREAFALQRYQEARARYGARYTEYLRYYGISPSDARLQRPEYLGGGKQTISFSEVLQTSNDGTNGNVGEMFGHGISAMRSRRFIKFFEEHGYVVSLMSIRPRTMYVDGLHRMFNRRNKEDYFTKELQHIGQQEILNKEVYANATSPGDTFGYQDRYMEYRNQPSGVSGEFRSTLNYWHMARIFASEPSLNQSFTDCDPSKRNFASQSTDTLWIMANHSIQARRLVDAASQNRIY